MVFGRDYEIARPSAIPDWLREFAEGALRKSSTGSNPFQEIKSLFQKNKELGAIEDRVRELKDRIGLSLLAKTEDAPSVKTAALKTSSVHRLIRLANWLDEQGFADEAQEVDSIIQVRASEKELSDLFSNYPKLKIFVDNVIRSRGGHVSIPAILKMIRDERPEESQAASDESLKQYVENKIKEEKKEINDSSDSLAGFGVGLGLSPNELHDDLKMFEPPEKPTM